MFRLLGVVSVCVWACLPVCAEWGCLLNPLGSLSVCPHTTHWQPGRRAEERVPTHLPIERQRYGHNVSDRLAVSTAPPFLLLWPEINHKYPPCPPTAQPQTPSDTQRERRPITQQAYPGKNSLVLHSRITRVFIDLWTLHEKETPQPWLLTGMEKDRFNGRGRN